MNATAEYHKDLEALPAALRTLLEAELAAGNAIVEVGHSFPAPPVGAYFKLARPVSTHPRSSGAGVHFCNRNSSLHSGEFTDAHGFYFILEPPNTPTSEPDMDAIRARAQVSTAPSIASTTPQQTESSLKRFMRSMVMDFEKWHDGTGYDLEALRSASAEERKAIEAILVHRGTRAWQDVEALAQLDTPRAKAALETALAAGNHEVRLAVARHAPDVADVTRRTKSLVDALQHAGFFGGLTEALDQAATFHPPEVIAALFHGVLHRDGSIAVHFAALLLLIHGKANAPFDQTQLSFFLQFKTQDRAEREVAVRELCRRIGADPEVWLAKR